MLLLLFLRLLRAEGVFAKRTRCVSFWRPTIQRSYIFISWRYPPIAEHVKFCEGNSQTHLHREAFYISSDRDRIVDTSWLASLCCFLLTFPPFHTSFLLLPVFRKHHRPLLSKHIHHSSSRPTVTTGKETHSCISVFVCLQISVTDHISRYSATVIRYTYLYPFIPILI